MIDFIVLTHLRSLDQKQMIRDNVIDNSWSCVQALGSPFRSRLKENVVVNILVINIIILERSYIDNMMINILKHSCGEGKVGPWCLRKSILVQKVIKIK